MANPIARTPSAEIAANLVAPLPQKKKSSTSRNFVTYKGQLNEMKHSVTLLQLCVLFIWSSVNAQELSEFRWKNRLVILATDSIESTVYKAQVSDLRADMDGLNIRKLIVITLTPTLQKTGISAADFETIHPDYKKFISGKSSFKFYLIGLDGGIKFSSDKKVSNDALFSIIDVMPMRRQEIENN